ncbi:MAG: hypothetical protein RR189_02165, partial [Bacilli bacterium]
MKKEIEMLNTIYRIVEMGVVGIDDVITKIEDNTFETLVNTEKKEYLSIMSTSIKLLKTYDEEPKKINKVFKTSSYIMSNMKLMNEHKDHLIARMMFEGNNKGVMEIYSKINTSIYKNTKITDLANKLLYTMENNINELK